jgi:uncharacterized protein (TIGR02594 family)
MTALPAAYAWLRAETGPRMLIEALKLFGTLETPGPGDNPVILAWADEVGAGARTAYATWAAGWYADDSTPWCGLFAAVVAIRAGKTPPEKYLSAAEWAKFGSTPAEPGLGDVLVFTRTGGGHVGLYVGDDATHFHVLGGNQGDAVSIVRIDKTRCSAIRRPPYINQPANVRRIHLAPAGAVSRNEA